MYSDADLDAAVAAGAITPDAALALRGYVAARTATPVADEEHFRLLTGFNDIFVAVAIALLLAALAQIGPSIMPGLGGALVAAASWGLAEYFTARRRMALPSILLLLGLIYGIAACLGALAGQAIPHASDRAGAGIAAAIGLVCALGAWLHWRRFAVPITVAAGAAALVAVAIGLVIAAFPAVAHDPWPLLLPAGLGVFTLAMRWDVSDPERRTRRSDVAFWLHLVAAPMIAHPLFHLLGVFSDDLTLARALVVLALYVVFAVVALAVDRRALLVSSLAYVLYALYSLFERAGVVGLSAALTALVIGSALLVLSALWQPIRRALVPLLGGIAGRLPPVASV